MNSFKLPKTYDFKATENKIYDWWDQGGYFKPDNDPNQPGFDPQIKPFVISIPPPNVTGELHLGHAMFVSMEDLMIRYHRMKGIPSLWVPGTDHAGIATQLQIEKALSAEGLTREQIGREDFLRRTWEWKAKYGGIITQQIRRLGASCDWDRERFTLDEGLSRSVRAAFVRLYEKGLIYRGPRLINWSPGLKTAVSDLEVEYSEEPGTLYYFKFMLAEAQGDYIPVATTRPETILGDTGLAVHPEDSRYQEFIGQEVLVPILDRRIPVIADEYVDREFGTGALKITPGHDPNDYEIGERHGLAVISVLDEAAKVNQHGGPYAGQDRFETRKNLWEDMRAAYLVIKEEPYMINIPRSQRGGEIIEPMISTQWFVRIQPLADAALEAVNDGRIQIIPERFKKVYNNWLENIEDWCISRQLWWGHRIPVWTCQGCSEVIVSQEDPTECTQCESENLVQDPDVLDTWFSSGLWPFSTLGWPEETADYGYFYPTSVMETGYDILFFWVARMIMDGIEFTGQVPFHTVYLHGLIRDETGRKMSKTYGNVIDPLIVMDELGTDALRFTLLVGSTPGNDMNLSLKKVEANRNFANKIWNAARFVLGALEQVQELQFPQQKTEPLPGLADQWIQARLSFLTRDAERLFQNYQYGEAGRQIYEFFWNEFADWYIEIAKLQLAQGDRMAYTTARNLVHVLDTCLRLLHPFTPFVTEEIWGRLKTAVGELKQPIISQHAVEWEDALIIARWPEPAPENPWETKAITDFSLIMELVRAVRNLRSEKNVDPKLKIPATLVGGEKTPLLQQQSATIAVLARLDPQKITISKNLDGKPEGHIALVIGPIEAYLPLAELVDPAEQRMRLQKEYATSMSQVERLENLLESPFAEKAPENVIEKERQKLADYQGKVEKIKSQLEALSTSDLG
ncbi:MAG TPA: valine--tRNA ligase [Anaerolineales bacterium]|nr:valine--tRNA ligase [Anaerolineales bacterium]